MEFLFPLFFYCGAGGFLLLLGGAFGMGVVLYVWSKLWVRDWASTHPVCFGACAALAWLPLGFALCSSVAVSLADGEAGLHVLEAQVKRESNHAMVSFFKKHAAGVEDARSFRESVVPEYARCLYERHPHLYLPVVQWEPALLSDDVCDMLEDVYSSRYHSDLEDAALCPENCNFLFSVTCRYLAQMQQEQNAERLKNGITWLPFWVGGFLISMVLIPILCLFSIRQAAFLPYSAPE